MKKAIVIGMALLCLSLGNLCAQESRFPSSLKEEIETILQDHQVPGAGIALVHRDSLIWAGGVGMANLKEGQKVEANSVFRIGSITKSFIALGILKLVEEGKLSLEDKLMDLAPEIEFDNPWRDTHPLRLFHLLEHTAGFDDMHFNEMVNLSGSVPSAREALEKNPKSRRVRWKPGTRASYSNPGYALAGYILEKFSGEPFEQFLKTDFLEPLGMIDASFELSRYLDQTIVQGYKTKNGEIVPDFVPEIFLRWAGSMTASPEDLSKLIRFFLNRGEVNGKVLLQAASIDRMETVTSNLAAQHGLNLGYGLANMSSVRRGYKEHGHPGGVNGFVSRYQYIKELNVGYVVLTNTANSAANTEISDLLVKYLTRGHPRPEARVSISKKPEQYQGYYRNANPRNEVFAGISSPTTGLKVFLRNDSLYAKPFMEAPRLLIPAGTNTFRYENYGDGHLIFIKDEEGRMTLTDANGLGNFYVRESAFQSKIILVTLVTSMLLVLSSIIVFLVRRVVFLLRKHPRHGNPGSELSLFLGAVCLILVLNGLSGLTLDKVMILGEINLTTLSLFLSGLGLGIFLLLGAGLTLVKIKQLKGAWKYYMLALSLASLHLVVVFYQWHLVGLRTWAW